MTISRNESPTGDERRAGRQEAGREEGGGRRAVWTKTAESGKMQKTSKRVTHD